MKLINRFSLGMFFLLVLPDLPWVMAADWYAAPDGKASGSGTRAAPWDLATALRGPGVAPGDTIYLRGGTYRGKYTSTLRGAAGNPVTVRSAPGEWAKIDGFATTTLAVTLDATGTTVTLADGAAFPEGSIVTIDGEQLNLYSRSGNRYTAARGWNGTPRASHTAGALVVAGGNNLTVNGRDTVYRDFEILNSDPVRAQGTPNAQNAPRLRGVGAWLAAPGAKLVNLVIHDCQEGVFAHASAANAEVYGCVITNNGYVAGGAYNGHGVYGQNTTGRKRFAELIVANNFSMGLKQESQNANTVGMDHDGVIAANNHSPAGTTTRRNNLLIGANNGRADDVTVTNSWLFHPPGTAGTSLRLGYVGSNGKAVVTGNTVLGGQGVLEVDYWSPLTVTGNRIASSGGPNELVLMRPISGGSVTWDGNQYWNGRRGSVDSFFHGSGSPPLTFAAWQTKTGFDRGSSYVPGPPTAPWVVVRPNRYEAGRAHVAVMNWTRAASVPVDLSAAGLAPGQRFEVRDAQNYGGAPVLTGTFDAARPTISLAMSPGPVAAPIGHSFTPASTLPLFGAFVVLPVTGGGAPLPPPPPPPPPPPVVDPTIAQAEAALQAWLTVYGPYAAGNAAFQQKFSGVLAELRKAR